MTAEPMDAFNLRVDLEDDDVARPSSESSAATDDLVRADTDDDQVVPGQQRPFNTLLTRRPLYEAPEFTQRLNVFEEVELGNGLTFECEVRAFPRPVVKWFKDDVEIPTSADDTRVSAEATPDGSSSNCSLLRLIIHDACKDDEGAYRCKAENEEGVAATTGYLSVAGPPTPQSPSSSPRSNAVSAPPLLRAITEQQSMEEREAADYQLQTTSGSGSGDEEYEYERLPEPSADDSVINSQLGWTYVDYMKAAGLEPGKTEADSGSDTSVEPDVIEDRMVVVKHTTASALPAGTRTSRDVAHRPPPPRPGHPGDVGSVNVFVVDSASTNAARGGDDMKPLIISSDVAPTSAAQESTLNHLSITEDRSFQDASGASVPSPPTQTSLKDATAEVDELASRSTGDVARSETNNDVFPAKKPEVESLPAEVSDRDSVVNQRTSVEFSWTLVFDFYAGWFVRPWIAYFVVVVSAALVASATEADPASVILAVLVFALFCFVVFPPPSSDDVAVSLTTE